MGFASPGFSRSVQGSLILQQAQKESRMDHPTPIRPADLAVYDPQKMGKATLYQ